MAAERPERIVIVGAGPAGLATARAYREHGGVGELTLLGAERMLPYQRPPLTKDFLRGELDAQELPIESRRWFQERGVCLRLGQGARAIDAGVGTVSLDADVLAADAIVLATGSEPLRAKLPGIDHAAVMTMRTYADSVRIADSARRAAHLLVLGTGFIGCEIAASLAMLGARVTLVGQEPLPQAQRLGEGAGRRIAGWLEELGVGLTMDATVSAVHDGRALELEDGRRLQADGVVLGTGVRPRVQLAEQAGLALSDGAIAVDARMRARSPGASVFAVGDVACAQNASAGRRLRVEHWGDALAHGEVAGRVLAGEDASWSGVPGFWSTIGRRTLKYAAWGDGYDATRLHRADDGAFVAWYGREGRVAGVLTHERDGDYDRGRELIAQGAPWPP
jgi:3-phenylpropionate/trans-cinnamate dioxygenase ferredoxin reductase component